MLCCLQVETKCRDDCREVGVGVERWSYVPLAFPLRDQSFVFYQSQINKWANQIALNIVWKKNLISPWLVSHSSFIDTYNQKKYTSHIATLWIQEQQLESISQPSLPGLPVALIVKQDVRWVRTGQVNTRCWRVKRSLATARSASALTSIHAHILLWEPMIRNTWCCLLPLVSGLLYPPVMLMPWTATPLIRDNRPCVWAMMG